MVKYEEYDKNAESVSDKRKGDTHRMYRHIVFVEDLLFQVFTHSVEVFFHFCAISIFNDFLQIA